MGAAAGLRLFALAVAWLGGVALQMQQPALWRWPAYAALALAALLAVRLGRRWFASRIAGIGVLAFALTAAHAMWQLSGALAPPLEDTDLVLTGVVAQLPRLVPEGRRFVFDVEEATLHGHEVSVPRRVSLGWYRGWDDDTLLAGPADELGAGQRWRFTARLRAPHGSLNPHGFDYELWLFEQGIRATGSVRASAAVPAQRLEGEAGFPVERLRQQVRDAIYRHVADPRAAGVLAALAVGDQAAIERSDWDLFRAAGVAHLMSISGLHVTMFAWLVGGLLRRVWRRSARLVYLCPTPLAARWGGLAGAAAYALLAGWGVPAQRTVWMLGTAALLGSLGLRWPWPLVLLAAAVVVTLFDPWALLQPGFWLSFMAVGLLMASEPPVEVETAEPPRWQRVWHTLRGGLRTQVVATLGLAPLTLVFFQQLSLVSFVANLVAIPLVTLFITPLALAGTLLPAVWQVAAATVGVLANALGWLVASPAAVFTVAVAPAWAQAAGLLAGLLLVMPLPWRLRVLALPLLLPLAWPPLWRPAEGSFEAVAADVGQGSAVLVRTHGHLLLYDTGPQYSRDSDAGQRVLLPLLRARGETGIDLLMLSHRDSDHVGGAAALIAALPVARLSSSLEPGHPLLGQRGVPASRCEAGQRWQWDGVAFEVLHPTAEDYARGLKPNGLSCVLRVHDALGHSLLLAGDIEAPQEAELLARSKDRLASDVLLMPHHGSRTSSTDALLDGVAPKAAVAQAGYHNRFGHPAPLVLARYTARGIEVLRSDTCGAWIWREGAMACQRDVARRYWHPVALSPDNPAPPP
jgi:competence protein ComEC